MRARRGGDLEARLGGAGDPFGRAIGARRTSSAGRRPGARGEQQAARGGEIVLPADARPRRRRPPARRCCSASSIAWNKAGASGARTKTSRLSVQPMRDEARPIERAHSRSGEILGENQPRRRRARRGNARRAPARNPSPPPRRRGSPARSRAARRPTGRRPAPGRARASATASARARAPPPAPSEPRSSRRRAANAPLPSALPPRDIRSTLKRFDFVLVLSLSGARVKGAEWGGSVSVWLTEFLCLA